MSLTIEQKIKKVYPTAEDIRVYPRSVTLTVNGIRLQLHPNNLAVQGTVFECKRGTEE